MMLLIVLSILACVARLVYVQAERRRHKDLEMHMLLAGWRALSDRLLESLQETVRHLQEANRIIRSIDQHRDQLEADRDIAKKLHGLHTCYVN